MYLFWFTIISIIIFFIMLLTAIVMEIQSKLEN